MFNFFRKEKFNPVEDRQLGNAEALEAVGGTLKQQEEFIPPEETGLTQYDKLVNQAEKSFASDSHAEIIEGFDRLSDKEEQQREDARRGMGNKFLKHARGGNSKPIEKDYKGGESLSDLPIADNDNQARQEEILKSLDNMAN